MAISKKRKEELVAQYQDWFSNSKAVIIAEYSGLTMNDVDNLRQKIREAGGEFHILKNTLCKIAFKKAGLPQAEGLFEGSTAAGFAFEDAPSLAKAIADFAKEVTFLKVKGGYLGERLVSRAEIEFLAEVPPLPIMRAQLLSTFMAPASQLVRILSEPGRQVASVVRAYADQLASPATA